MQRDQSEWGAGVKVQAGWKYFSVYFQHAVASVKILSIQSQHSGIYKLGWPP